MFCTRLMTWSALALALITSQLLAADIKEIPVPAPAPVEKLPAVLENAIPMTLEDLKAIQEQTKKVLAKVIPATVGLQVGGASGSGVIISEDGFVLTAGHVSGKPDQNVVVILHDGKRVQGKSLGANQGIDSGMIKITTEGKYPFVAMARSTDLPPGTWCITTGHPGGYKPGRSPVVRLGRVLENARTYLRTDCTLVGGDSGGPLFDMKGNVIGIHSRIGGSIRDNMHVPVDTYRETWDRLVKGESWGGRFPFGGGAMQAFLGLQFDPSSTEPRIIGVVKDSPAFKAGVLVDDLVSKFDGKEIKTADEVTVALAKKKPGDEVTVEVLRDSKPMPFKLTLGRK